MSEQKPKTGFEYPTNEPMLLVRPCLLAMSLQIRPAAKLLSVLLYHARLCSEQEITFCIYRTQEELIRDMCGDMSDKTLHDVAVPALLLLGFLDLQETMGGNGYIVHLNIVRQALALYVPNQSEQPQLEKFLISCFQLEKFLISCPELEKFPINKRNFQLQLEKVLIRIRKSSNCPRGRKANPEARSKGKNKKTEILRDKRDITRESLEVSAIASPHPLSPFFSSQSLFDEDFVTIRSVEEWAASLQAKYSKEPRQKPVVEHNGNGIRPRLSLPMIDPKQIRMDETEQGMIHMLLDPSIKADVFYLRDQKYTVTYYQKEGETFFLIKDPDTGKRDPYNLSSFLQLVAKVRQDSAELSKRGIAGEVQNVLNEVFGEEKRFPDPPPHTPAIETTPLQASNSPVSEETPNHTASTPNTPISGSQRIVEAFVSEEVAESAARTSKQPVSHSQGATGNDAPRNGASEDKQASQTTLFEEQPTPAPTGRGTGKRTSKKQQQERTETDEPPKIPEMPPASMKWGTRKCLLKFDAWRGAPLIVDWKLKKASSIAKNMAETYTEEKVDKVRTRMNKDPYYVERGGSDIFDVGNNIAKYLKIIEREEQRAQKSRSNGTGQGKSSPSEVAPQARPTVSPEKQAQIDAARAKIAEQKRQAEAMKGVS